MISERIPIGWRRLEPPLEPTGVVATGAAAARLATNLLDRRSVGHSTGVAATAGPGWLVALGDEADLPWADGAVYLAPQAGLLLPTTHTTVPDVDLVATAVRRRWGRGPGTLVVLVGSSVLAGPAPVGPVALDRLWAVASVAG